MCDEEPHVIEVLGFVDPLGVVVSRESHLHLRPCVPVAHSGGLIERFELVLRLARLVVFGVGERERNSVAVTEFLATRGKEYVCATEVRKTGLGADSYQFQILKPGGMQVALKHPEPKKFVEGPELVIVFRHEPPDPRGVFCCLHHAQFAVIVGSDLLGYIDCAEHHCELIPTERLNTQAAQETASASFARSSPPRRALDMKVRKREERFKVLGLQSGTELGRANHQALRGCEAGLQESSCSVDRGDLLVPECLADVVPDQRVRLIERVCGIGQTRQESVVDQTVITQIGQRSRDESPDRTNQSIILVGVADAVSCNGRGEGCMDVEAQPGRFLGCREVDARLRRIDGDDAGSSRSLGATASAKGSVQFEGRCDRLTAGNLRRDGPIAGEPQPVRLLGSVTGRVLDRDVPCLVA